MDIVIVYSDAFGQAYFEIEELLAVDVFRDAETRCRSSRVPLHGVLLEGYCREISFPPERLCATKNQFSLTTFRLYAILT